jgi:DNA-binding winged helix-turn-helix (wHTH) protein/tetratricopeptide (TPR) repeat protein
VSTGPLVVFGPFSMDLAGQRLWRDGRPIRLRPKSWDVLRYLVERPGLLVTKEAIHAEVWRGTAVSDDTLTQSIGELRRALGDATRTPRFIETVHGRGFRFIGQVGTDTPTELGDTSVDTAEAAFPVVGREQALSRLHECLRRARQGARQLVFITGEAGIGKTTLAETFLRSPELRSPDVLILHGQCIQQHGRREPYMPLLEALERLLSSPAGEILRASFRTAAPCWHIQMPALLADMPSDVLSTGPLTAPAERMLREGAVFLETVAARSTVVLLLEDLHWSDTATAEFLSYIAQRRDSARLLIIGTYRPAEASADEHPIRAVKQMLRVRRRCVELELGYLTLAAVEECLRARFGSGIAPLARLIHRRTDGNPLFVVALVEDLLRRDRLTRTAGGWTLAEDHEDPKVPDDLADMMASQFRGLTADERSLLEAGSVVGDRFLPETVARAVGSDVEHIDALAQQMARARLFLTSTSDPSPQRVARPYEFIHALHRYLIYEQIPDRKRRRLHLVIGETLEAASGERAPEIAAELSVHFERGGDPGRAMKHLTRCVALARQRLAPREALAFGKQALGLLDHLPETRTRHEQELELHMLLGPSLAEMHGYTSAHVRDSYARARWLCEQVDDPRRLFEIVHAAWYRQLGGAESDGARQSAEELERIAEALTPVFRWRATLAHGRTELWAGRFGTAVPMLRRCVDELDKHPVEISDETYGVDPSMAAFVQLGLGLWFIGCPDQARAYAATALARAEALARPLNLASALCQSARIDLLCGNAVAGEALAARALAICTDHSVGYFLPMSRFVFGAALVDQGDLAGGLPQMLDGLAAHRETTGAFLSDFTLALIGAAHGRAGRWDEALRYIDEGLELVEQTLERLYVAELWRVKGELLAARARSKPRRGSAADRATEAAVDCVRRALGIAREQEARSLELRAATSLTRLLAQREEREETLQILRAVYATFREGFDTKDLQEAQTLLATGPPASGRAPSARSKP